ncbi:hypothetical protein AURDEDRAFT_187651 [Auricularia subglabra TFB-10046 SS5]|nr:hypothetical protein AURDEDRAFT_187651 [Auricularia subglabra TFB-10046 SS5]
MVTFTPLLHTPCPFSEFERASRFSSTSARDAGRDRALHPFVLVNGEVFVDPCADLDAWYASGRDDAVVLDRDPPHGTEDLSADENACAEWSKDVLLPAPELLAQAAPSPCALPPGQCDLASCWLWSVPECADDREDGDESESLSGITWSSDSVTNDCFITDDELEHHFTPADGPKAESRGDSPMKEMSLELAAATGSATMPLSDTLEPGLLDYEALIPSILSAAAAYDRLL